MIEFTHVWGREEGIEAWFTSHEKAQSEELLEAIVPGTMNITGQTEVTIAAN